MFEHVLYFNIHDKRMKEVSTCAFHISLNEVLINELEIDPRPLFTHKSTAATLETLMLNLGRRGLLNKEPNRIPANTCSELFEKIRDDPCFKEIADCISLEKFYSITALIRTSYCQPKLNIFLSLHA